MDEEDQLRFGFDLLDPTKIVPEELVPVTKLGKMQLNRNPMNYFAETEQAMVCPPSSTKPPHTNKHRSSNQATSSAASTSQKIPSSKAESSPTWTPN
jgi:catalase